MTEQNPEETTPTEGPELPEAPPQDEPIDAGVTTVDPVLTPAQQAMQDCVNGALTKEQNNLNLIVVQAQNSYLTQRVQQLVTEIEQLKFVNKE